jgi:hypothetical protein
MQKFFDKFILILFLPFFVFGAKGNNPVENKLNIENIFTKIKIEEASVKLILSEMRKQKSDNKSESFEVVFFCQKNNCSAERVVMPLKE